MKTRPIIFSGEMVRAILSGQKVQTRRIVKPQPPDWAFNWVFHHRDSSADFLGNMLTHRVKSPLGRDGDLLWVKETWRLWGGASFDEFGEPQDPDILTGSLKFDEEWVKRRPIEYAANCDEDGPWRSSTHMPRWASRITLEITGVRVERVQEITEEDARKEGVVDGGCLICGRSEPCGCLNPSPDATEGFCRLWQSIYGCMSWNDNPWVWVYEFRRVRNAE